MHMLIDEQPTTFGEAEKVAIELCALKPPVFIDLRQVCLPNDKWRWKHVTHLFTLPNFEDELHLFAKEIGLNRVWFQRNGTMPHYDLNDGRREVALRVGVTELNKFMTVAVIRLWGVERRKRDEQTKVLRCSQ